MRESNVPKRLWDYGIKHAARIGHFIPKQRPEGRTPLEAVTGDTPDISEYLDFDFYDLVWYHPHTHPSISTDSGELARWIGVAHRVESDMYYWLLLVSGIQVSSTTVQHVTRDDMLDRSITAKI